MTIDFKRHQELMLRGKDKKKRPCLVCGRKYVTTSALRTCCFCAKDRDQMGLKAEQKFQHIEKR